MSDINVGPAVTSGPGLTPPQALDAERSIIAAMLLDVESIGRAIEQLEPDAFYRTAHRKIYDALVGLYSKSEPADLITVTEELRKRGDLEAIGGTPALGQILEYATTSANLEHHIKIVMAKSILRKLIKATGDIQQQAYSATEETAHILDAAEARIFSITDARIRTGFVSIRDLLKPTFDNIQKLFERKVHVTGVPTGFDDLDKLTAGLQPSDLIIIAGRPSMGKCARSCTRIDDPETGERVTIEECVRRKLPSVMGISPAGRVRKTDVGAWIDSGIKPCFRVTTRIGRSIDVTGHHPFMTINGWQPLHDIPVGVRIALPRAVPVFGRDESWSFERIRLLAYFIAEGGLTTSIANFTNTDPVLVRDFRESLAHEFPACQMKVRPNGVSWDISRTLEARAASIGRLRFNPVTRWLREQGLMGKKSNAKRIPAAVWRFDRPRLAEFLRILFSCDGTIYAIVQQPRIEFTVASSELAEDVQHALTRFGIVAKRWQKTETSFRVEITDPDAVDRYQREIGWLGEKTKRPDLEKHASNEARHPCRGGAPPEVWARVRAAAQLAGVTVTEVARRAGEFEGRGHNLHARRAIRRERLMRFAEVLDDPDLKRIASPDLYWDEIVSIEPIGSHPVFDLNVPDGANFIAEDVCVHNTSVAMNIAENAAVRHAVPVAVFSLEMSKEQLALRLLCSQSEVALSKLRTGFLSNDDWPRLTTGAGLLTQAPIYIDDSAGQSVLEIRAKCRRLKAENKLGLVIVDYLQLMRSSGPAENRVQEISQISRGLKELAKELQVPVVALSQLSRAVEQRGGAGRPQLSDLRESGCLTADTRIARADTGEEVTMNGLLQSGARNIPVWTVDASLRVVEGTMTHVFASGVKPVFEMRLASDKKIKGTANHRFLTLDGWKALADLSPGNRLATPRQARGARLAGPLEALDQPRAAERALATAMMTSPALSESDVFWDAITSITPLGVQPVFDATVLGTHNFIANGIVAHNSIEQDADVVMFIYREVVYKPDTQEPGKAQLIVAKQRNGPTDDVDLTFLRDCTKFVPYSPMMPGETDSNY